MRVQHHRSTGWACSVVLALAGSACGASSAQEPPPQAAPTRYEGTCAFLGIEEVAGPTDQNADSVSLVATYQLEPKQTRGQDGPLSLKFRVERSRVGDLRSHLEQHPNVLCHPGTDTHEAGLDHNAAYSLDVPPFEGQRGELVR